MHLSAGELNTDFEWFSLEKVTIIGSDKEESRLEEEERREDDGQFSITQILDDSPGHPLFICKESEL